MRLTRRRTADDLSAMYRNGTLALDDVNNNPIPSKAGILLGTTDPYGNDLARSQQRGGDEQKCLGNNDFVRNANAKVDLFPSTNPPKLSRKKSISNVLNFKSNNESNSRSTARAPESDHYDDSSALSSSGYAKHQASDSRSRKGPMLRAMRSEAGLPRSSIRDSIMKKQDESRTKSVGPEKDRRSRRIDIGNIFPPQTKTLSRMFKPNRWSQAPPPLEKVESDDDFPQETIFVQLKRPSDNARFETCKTYKTSAAPEPPQTSRAKIFEEEEIYGSIKPNVKRPPKGIKNWFDGVDISSDEEIESENWSSFSSAADVPLRTSSLETSELWSRVRHSHRPAKKERRVSRDPVEDNLMAIEHAKQQMQERRRLATHRRGSDDSEAVDSATSLPKPHTKPVDDIHKAETNNTDANDRFMLSLSSDEEDEDENESEIYPNNNTRVEVPPRAQIREPAPVTTKPPNPPPNRNPFLLSTAKSPADRSAEHLDATLKKLSSNELSPAERSNNRESDASQVFQQNQRATEIALKTGADGGCRMMSVTAEEMAILQMMRHKRATLQTNPFVNGYQNPWKAANEQSNTESRFTQESSKSNWEQPKSQPVVGHTIGSVREESDKETKMDYFETRTREESVDSSFLSLELEDAFPQPPVQTTRPATSHAEVKSQPGLMNPFNFDTSIAARPKTAGNTSKDEDEDKDESWRSLINGTPGDRDSMFPLPPSSRNSIEPKSRQRISSLPPTPESTRGRSLSIAGSNMDHSIRRPLSTIESSPSPSSSPARHTAITASNRLSRTIELAPSLRQTASAFPLRPESDVLVASILDAEFDHFSFPTMQEASEPKTVREEQSRSQPPQIQQPPQRDQRPANTVSPPARSPVSSPPSAVDSAISIGTASTCSPPAPYNRRGQRLSLLISPTESLASNYHPSHQHAAAAAAGGAQNFSRRSSSINLSPTTYNRRRSAMAKKALPPLPLPIVPIRTDAFLTGRGLSKRVSVASMASSRASATEDMLASRASATEDVLAAWAELGGARPSFNR